MLRRSVFWGVAGGLPAALLLLTALARAGVLTVAIERPVDTHFFWFVARAAGATAYLALTLDMVCGLLLSTAVGDAWIGRARGVELHKWLSTSGLALTLAHALPLVADAFVSFDALDLLVPFIAPYRPMAVGLGVLGLYGWLAVYGSFWLRRSLGQSAWRRLHRVSFAVFLMATAHGLLAGSDTGQVWARAGYLAATALVLWLTVYRLLLVGLARGLFSRGRQRLT